MLQLTRVFGPILTIIKSMFTEVGKFLFIWIVVLCMLASVASLLFGHLQSYAGFLNSLYLQFGSGFGNYELEEFRESTYPEEFGKFFVVFTIIINSIILLNFIIAILADTYSTLSQKKLGLYYDGIIARIPVYEDDSRYGGLIIGTPPFNIFAIFLVPLFCCFRKNEKRAQLVNERFTKVAYAPIALLILLIFASLTLVMIPFGYIIAIYHKLRILCLIWRKGREKNDKAGASKSKRRTPEMVVKDLVIFLLFGVPMLIISWAVDCFYFLKSTYRDDIKNYSQMVNS